MIKKALKITGITLLSLTVILFAAPFFFKGKIIALVKSEINKNINAQADFADANMSLFRHFPRVSLMLNDLRITGLDNFAKDTLFSAPKIDVALDLMSVIKGNNYKVYSVTVDNPRIHAIINKEGKANWDIAKEDTATITPTDQKPFNMQLKRYEIRDAFVAYRDETSNMSSDIYNLNHSGSGDFN